MKKYVISLMLTLLVFSGCDALGIKQADNSSSDNISLNEEAASPVTFDNQISASTGQQAASEEILNLQKEIDELVSAVNAKDIALTELENKLKLLEDEKQQITAKAASSEAELSDLKDTISVNNQYRNIAIIVAFISLLCNALLAYLLIRARIRYKRAALPPAKDDTQDCNVKEDVETPVQESETNIDVNADVKINKENSDTSKEESAAVDGNETIKQPAKKRGRPKAADKSVENIEKPVSKRGRPKKENQNNM